MFDFHLHSVFSDGELIPAEIARRYQAAGYEAVAITDHVDATNMEFILTAQVAGIAELNDYFDGITIFPGVEITHAPPKMIEGMVERARSLGAKIVVVHGETPAEPVMEGTNAAAVEIPGIDIISHPGRITPEDAARARDNDILLEITSRKGHRRGNSHVAMVAQDVGAKMILNSDTHAPEDILGKKDAMLVAKKAGLTLEDSEIIISNNPEALYNKYKDKEAHI